MTLTSSLQADVEAVYTPTALPNPYPAYENLRRHGDLIVIPEWNSAFVLGLEPVNAIFRHAHARAERMGDPNEHDASDYPTSLNLLRNMMLFHDHAAHARLRGLVSQAFTPRAIEETHEFITGTVQGLLAEFNANGGDFVSSVAVPIPMLVILELLGVSSAEREKFKIWTTSLVHLFNGMMNDQIERDAIEMRSYFNGLANELRTSDRGGVLAAMARAEAGALSNDELLSNAVLLLAAGYETTTSVIAGATLEFSRQPDAWQTLLEHPEHLPTAVEESLRLVSPVQGTSRMAGQDLEVQGQTIPAGTNISLLLGAANRDPKRFSDPARLDVTRANAKEQVAFASGPHYCLGAPLARLEVRTFLETMLKTYPGYQVPDQPLEYAGNVVLRGLGRLEVRLTRGP